MSIFGKPKYKIDFHGAEGDFRGVKKSYAAGERVTVYYPFIATDTDYLFFIDAESVNYQYDDKRGFVISFIMPDHDVSLTYTHRNSMTVTD